MKEYDFAPFSCHEIDLENGSFMYRLVLPVFEDGTERATELLEAHGVYPNGPGWEGTFTYMIDQHAPDWKSMMSFNSEGDAFLAEFQEEAHMIQVATFLQSALADEALLTEYLANLPDEYRYV